MDDSPDVTASSHVFSGRVFDVRVDQLRYGDGSSHRMDVVEHGPSFTIAAVPAPGWIVLVRQYRHPAGRAMWELPAGSAEAGEDARTGAMRELREETGYRAGRMHRFATLYSTPGFCDEVMHFFYADGLEAGEQALDEDERIEVRSFTFDDAWRLVGSGDIADCKTALALLWIRAEKAGSASGFDG